MLLMQDYHGKIWWQKQSLMLNYKVLTKGLLQTKHLLVENELKKLKTFDLSYLLARTILKKMAHKII